MAGRALRQEQVLQTDPGGVEGKAGGVRPGGLLQHHLQCGRALQEGGLQARGGARDPRPHGGVAVRRALHETDLEGAGGLPLQRHRRSVGSRRRSSYSGKSKRERCRANRLRGHQPPAVHQLRGGRAARHPDVRGLQVGGRRRAGGGLLSVAQGSVLDRRRRPRVQGGRAGDRMREPRAHYSAHDGEPSQRPADTAGHPDQSQSRLSGGGQ
mmetsp:Transcript_21833/g.47921  ORF Transcript_21833/g.47921 Transcript_21833/m.47921 type:complete len:211 (-) Transcript_21833:282-914(-)